MPDAVPLRIVVVNGSPRERSKTASLAEVAVEAFARDRLVDRRRIDVYRLGRGFTDALDRESVTGDVDDQLRSAEEADLIIAATPIFRGSYSGMFKHFFDLVEQYGLANKPVLLLATGGGAHHALALDHALRPLFAFFQALTLPTSIFASSGDFDGTTLLNPRVYSRVHMAVDDARTLLRTNSEPLR